MAEVLVVAVIKHHKADWELEEVAVGFKREKGYDVKKKIPLVR